MHVMLAYRDVLHDILHAERNNTDEKGINVLNKDTVSDSGLHFSSACFSLQMISCKIMSVL